jgi:aerobic C4-dicarboxylate transport protein
LQIAAGLPAEGLALPRGIERFMSLARAIGNAARAIAVAKWDGEFDSAAWNETATET